MKFQASTGANSQASYELVNDFGSLADGALGIKSLNIE